MAYLDEMQFVERLQFFNGQRLLADDLQGLEGMHRELRELHNRSLHQPGIGNGFAVTGVSGDREVTVGPGYALDAAGHEIILTDDWKEQVPPVSGESDGGPAFFYLTISYPGDEDLEEAETRAGICRTHGVVRLREAPVFCWVRLQVSESGVLSPADTRLKNDIGDGHKIILAQVEVQHCQLQRLSIVQRRNARPSQQPRIYCERYRPDWTLEALTPPGGTADASDLVFLLANVNTSAAGFRSVPCYSARITGPRNLMFPYPVSQERFVEGLMSIENSQLNGFQLKVLIISGVTEELANLDADQISELFNFDPENPNDPYWAVEWMGVE